MSIFNQSIKPQGQPALPAKVPNIHEASQQLQGANLANNLQFTKSLQSIQPKKKIMITNHGGFSQRDSCYNSAQLNYENQRQGDMFANERLCNFMSNTSTQAEQGETAKTVLETHQVDQIARRMEKLTGSSKIRIENSIDPSLIAGFVITYETEGSHVIDLSVKGQLDQLAAHIESTDQKIDSQCQSWSILSKES
ncbi:hypothetical protein AMTR_s00045p00041590 [Amborella trichopoda]|uniref:Uncharacterized protein n=1 Tax=Amborella trichopoda TaxID=13333 RepID=W1P4Q6_AMBTC|nr:hypothetical protein AMTR_s00045p00041590 [Amborella trichopoda]